MKLINLAKIDFAGGNSGGGQGSSVIPIVVFDPEELALTAESGKYYRADTAVNTLTITLPAVEDDTKVYEAFFCFTTGTAPDIKFVTTDGNIVRFADGFEFEAGKTYEVQAVFNGSYWSIFNRVIAPFTIDALKFTVNEGSPSGTITLTIPSGLTQEECTNIEYSLDGRTWVTFVNEGNGLTITTPTLNAGDSVYFRGQATLISKSSSVYSHFTTSSSDFKISASGSIMCLLGDSKTLTMYAFYQLFYNCTSLTTAPELPATQLIEYCYQGMFQGCTSLTTAPELPATELKGHCYRSMFQGCSSLVNAPELPATKAEYYCYGAMFNGCSSLTTAPELPATVLANYCYQSMFGDCTSLTTAPILRAAETTRYSYENMFFNCTNINKITMLATTIGYNALASWLYGVAATGTFIKNPAMTTLPTGPSGIPSGWTVQDNV